MLCEIGLLGENSHGVSNNNTLPKNQTQYLYLLDLRVAAVVCVALFFAGLRVARAILRFLFGRRRRAPVPSGVLS